MDQASQSSILIVEDDADNLLITLELLRRHLGAQRLRGLPTGDRLLELMESDPEFQPELILLDIDLPGADGYEVLAQLRRHPHLGATRVIAFTTNITSQSVARARAAGFNGFIGKPMDHRRFPEQVQRLLNGIAVWEAR
ncbi:MAG: response regulator [Ardenticatenales bacterium]|nr:response regulator [Ardenticatenales bacterium]